MKNKKKKKPLTLLEIMIVIFLIGLIGSVIGYNMKGSLDEGRAFKTDQAINQIKDILNLEIARGEDPERVCQNPESFLKHSGIVKDPKKLLKDGWGTEMKISYVNNNISVKSEKYTAYKAAKRAKIGKTEAQAADEENGDDS